VIESALMKHLAITVAFLVSIPLARPADKLLSGSLDGWQVVGDGIWTVMRDGTLVGQRDPNKAEHQSWLYTIKNDYAEFDLHLEWWTKVGGNSGVSIRDSSRGLYAVGATYDEKRTPSHIGYEIQISNGYPDQFASGSVYLFDAAKPGHQIENDWNAMDIESRDDMIRVKLNGALVSQYAGEPGRPKTGPIGLQLHDKTSLVMFRNIRIKELKSRK
jgi:3-keto-disaccharide hydrolase